jgi:hypothetical protein
VTRGWTVSALSLACALAAVPVTSDGRGARASHPAQAEDAAVDVTGVWQTTQNEVPAEECGHQGSVVLGAPWTFWMTQVGTTLSGTLQQGPWGNECAPDPVPIEDGTIEGNLLSFRLENPAGSTVEFVGAVQADGRSLALTRSVVAPGAGPGGSNSVGLFDLHPDYYPHFTVQRVTSSEVANECLRSMGDVGALLRSSCEAADPQAPPFATGTSRWVATDGIGFSPWTFDLTIGLHGAVTGSVSQSTTDPASRSGSVLAGPFTITSGYADARRLAFSVRSPDAAHIVSFSGVRRGVDEIDFRRILTRPPGRPSLEPDRTSDHTDLFGLAGARRFTAYHASVDPTAAPPAALSGVPSDDTVTLESVEDRFAAVPASSPDASAAAPQRAVARLAFVLIRYQLQPTFQGRLFVLALDATGQPIRRFEVIATPGRHVALWDLRSTGAGRAIAADNSATEQDLRVDEMRATIVADAIRLATDAPSEAAATGLAATLSAMLAGPGGGDATQAGSRFVAPGNDTIALARLDGGSLTLLATRPCVVSAASGK